MAKRKGRRRTVGRVALLALLAVVFLTFRGSFPLSGNRESDDGAALRPNQASALPAPIGGTLGEGASRSRPGPGPEPEPTKLTGDDPAGGRSERLEWLIANDHYADAIELAEAMRDGGADEVERRLAADVLDHSIAVRLEKRLRAAMGRREFIAAERELGLLARASAKRASELVPSSAAKRPRPEEITALAEVLELPIDLEGGASLWQIRNGSCVLREAGAGGGLRYRTVAVTDVDPLVWRRILAKHGKLLDLVARAFAAESRPIAASLVREGSVELRGKR